MADAKREVAEAFDALRKAATADRGHAPVKHVGKGRSRPIIVTDAEGNPKRVATHDRLLEGLLEREGVEAVVEGKRPRVVRCIEPGCRKMRQVKPGPMPARCEECTKERRREFQRVRKASPEYRERNRDRERKRYAMTEVRERTRKRNATPEVRERMREYYRAYRARKKAEREAAKQNTPTE